MSTALRKKTNLCIDADDQVLSVRKFMLEMRGYAVETAKSDDQAIKQCNIDLILSRLPSVIGEVKAMGLGMPTIFLAGYAELGRAEADGVLMQDTQSPVEVLATVKTLLSQFKLKRQQWHNLKLMLVTQSELPYHAALVSRKWLQESILLHLISKL